MRFGVTHFLPAIGAQAYQTSPSTWRSKPTPSVYRIHTLHNSHLIIHRLFTVFIVLVFIVFVFIVFLVSSSRVATDHAQSV